MGWAMKALKLLQEIVVQPENLIVLTQAFDEGWEAIKSRHDTNPQSTEVARLRLANAVLAAYRDGVTDPDALKVEALKLMQR